MNGKVDKCPARPEGGSEARVFYIKSLFTSHSCHPRPSASLPLVHQPQLTPHSAQVALSLRHVSFCLVLELLSFSLSSPAGGKQGRNALLSPSIPPGPHLSRGYHPSFPTHHTHRKQKGRAFQQTRRDCISNHVSHHKIPLFEILPQFTFKTCFPLKDSLLFFDMDGTVKTAVAWPRSLLCPDGFDLQTL